MRNLVGINMVYVQTETARWHARVSQLSVMVSSSLKTWTALVWASLCPRLWLPVKRWAFLSTDFWSLLSCTHGPWIFLFTYCDLLVSFKRYIWNLHLVSKYKASIVAYRLGNRSLKALSLGRKEEVKSGKRNKTTPPSKKAKPSQTKPPPTNPNHHRAQNW